MKDELKEFLDYNRITNYRLVGSKLILDKLTFNLNSREFNLPYKVHVKDFTGFRIPRYLSSCDNLRYLKEDSGSLDLPTVNNTLEVISPSDSYVRVDLDNLQVKDLTLTNACYTGLIKTNFLSLRGTSKGLTCIGETKDSRATINLSGFNCDLIVQDFDFVILEHFYLNKERSIKFSNIRSLHIYQDMNLSKVDNSLSLNNIKTLTLLRPHNFGYVVEVDTLIIERGSKIPDNDEYRELLKGAFRCRRLIIKDSGKDSDYTETYTKCNKDECKHSFAEFT